MTTDFRALCAELVDCLEKADWPGQHKELFQFWADIARAALAEPEPEGPTLDDIWNLCERYEFVLGSDGSNEEESVNVLWEIARAVLARFGRPAPQPIPVSERLPGPGDCDAEGECYWFDPEGSGAWYQDTYQGNYTHWLPVHALPQPS